MKKTGIIVGIIIFMILVILGCMGAYQYFTNPKQPNEDLKQSGDILSGNNEILPEQPNENLEQSDKISTEALFISGDYPKVDASLATQPLTDAFMANFTATPISEINPEYTNTHPSYLRLIDGEVDLIVVTSPSEEELTYARQKGVELEVIPVVNEAFIFMANKQNPVNGLTIKQVQDIYSGKITNWKEVGGDDEAIIPYQRPTNSGSQTGMLDLVMKDIPMIEPTTETFEETMAGIIEAVANYDNAKAALGYSYYYYATTMYSQDSIKLLAMDEVEPNFETIKNGEYPIQTAYYIVINKAEPEESNTRKLVEAMLSERGQAVAKEAGYVPVK